MIQELLQSKPRLSAGLLAPALALGFGMAVMAPTNSYAVVQTFNINQTIEAGGRLTFDLNGDGADDYEIEILTPNVQDSTETFELARIRGIFPELPLPVSIIDDDDDEDFGGEDPNPEDDRDLAHKIFLANSESEFARVFSAGDTVFKDFRENDAPTGFEAVLYSDENGDEGPFSEIGSTGFIGLHLMDEFEASFFGFLEITRGSITVGQLGFQTDPNTGALIPGAVVPVPPSLAFMAVGALGLAVAGWRRRSGRSA